MQMYKSALIGLVAVVLAACGSDGGEVDRGGLVEKFEPAPLARLSSAQIDGATAASGLQAISGLARCDVEFIPIEYYTLGVSMRTLQSVRPGCFCCPLALAQGRRIPWLLTQRVRMFKSRELWQTRRIQKLSC